MIGKVGHEELRGSSVPWVAPGHVTARTRTHEDRDVRESIWPGRAETSTSARFVVTRRIRSMRKASVGSVNPARRFQRTETVLTPHNCRPTRMHVASCRDTYFSTRAFSGY